MSDLQLETHFLKFAPKGLSKQIEPGQVWLEIIPLPEPFVEVHLNSRQAVERIAISPRDRTKGMEDQLPIRGWLRDFEKSLRRIDPKKMVVKQLVAQPIPLEKNPAVGCFGHRLKNDLKEVL
ncbi:MAG: hypothetical protein DMG05_12865 [Acidobacteria bacterium]|nr:MAG: hypothetical protein DMG05_12865 [Acidobacteriota bacterium]